jgi:hypothetical protein
MKWFYVKADEKKR